MWWYPRQKIPGQTNTLAEIAKKPTCIIILDAVYIVDFNHLDVEIKILKGIKKHGVGPGFRDSYLSCDKLSA